MDASVAIKVALHEPDSPIAVAALRAQAWSAPDLILSECANIIWKRCRMGDITRDQAMQAVELIETMNLYVEPGRRLIERAVQLAIALEHPAYDCFYVAHAEQLGVPFLTADKKLIAKVGASEATGIEVMSLEDYAQENGL
ncbi:type II toxin-antitoxin system VapC family toxin [Brevundimonas sp. SL130]|uniref:type II toxin-antitoxin system VapC family toxin n=1 Tax=Brevundimonas sp. SL130 TaxID=2995143 RepID=UPI00226CB37F|nr:type II toxin-antitoxin system VapC family toxin [Brevundimonas sp. SL130]WAC61534.1 type II toxin-antitoxin system VapC family toxin [Brevundimonas sp. SL130]